MSASPPPSGWLAHACCRCSWRCSSRQRSSHRAPAGEASCASERPVLVSHEVLVLVAPRGELTSMRGASGSRRGAIGHSSGDSGGWDGGRPVVAVGTEGGGSRGGCEGAGQFGGTGLGGGGGEGGGGGTEGGN
eukprot:5968962-Prymnesium_polylepis.1